MNADLSAGVMNTVVDVAFEVFTAVTMENAVLWDVAPCISCVNGRFGGRREDGFPHGNGYCVMSKLRNFMKS
jgi:hypothetical protein